MFEAVEEIPVVVLIRRRVDEDGGIDLCCVHTLQKLFHRCGMCRTVGGLRMVGEPIFIGSEEMNVGIDDHDVPPCLL
jgi:hypothetical protein